tara:strand:- start:11961 stop:14066 length:2106 start_codon:yes stop_codon:yes gene_type:complete
MSQKKLSIEQISDNSPFKVASIPNLKWLNDEDSFTYLSKSKSIYKVNLVSNDTTIFLSRKNIKFKKNEIPIVDYQINSTNRYVLIQSEKTKIWRRSFYGTYFIYDNQKKEMIKLTEANDSLRNVKFSPDGNQLSFVRIDNNLYNYDIKKKKQYQLTKSGSENYLNGIFGWVYEEEFSSYDSYKWSPNSKKIIFCEENQSDVPVYTLIDELKLYPQLKNIRYPKAGQNNPKIKVGIVDATGGSINWINLKDNNDYYIPRIYWEKNGKIFLVKIDRSQKNITLLVYDIKSGKIFEGIKDEDTIGWVDLNDDYQFLDNDKLLWISEKSGFRHIHYSDINGNLINSVTKGQWEVNRILNYNQKDNKVYFTANRGSVKESHLFSINLDGSNLIKITNEEGFHRIMISPSKKYFIDSFSSIKSPPKIVLKNMRGNPIRILDKTNLNQYKEYNWSFPFFVNFLSNDKTVLLDGILTLPNDYDKNIKYPMIVYGYGMPGTQIVLNKWGNLINQFLAQEGFIVFSMDCRGMGGRGENFKNLSYGDMSKYLVKDIKAGVNYIINNYSVNANKIGAWGSSGGGYFTALMLTRLSSMFSVGVSISPVVDFRLYDSIYSERSMGNPNFNKAGYDSVSIMSHVDNFKGNLLVMHGTGDDNVHFQNTTQLINSFIDKNKMIDVFIYPNRDHSLSGGTTRYYLNNKLFNYFNEKLKN